MGSKAECCFYIWHWQTLRERHKYFVANIWLLKTQDSALFLCYIGQVTSAEDILTFWFETAGSKKWYNASDAFDASIRQKFEDRVVQIAGEMRKTGRHDWLAEARSSLALIIALDQFPRNMYRGTIGAFALDDIALQSAMFCVGSGFDLQMMQNERAFFYMPYMHAEDLAVQEECVHLCDQRLDSESTLRHAKAHRDLIARFGRFPHRNAVLGRTPTDQETQFLESGGYAPR